MADVARDLGISEGVLYGWVRRLRREIPTSKRHFKKVGCDPRDQTPTGRRAMITMIAEQTGGSIRQVCAVLGEPRSSFYDAATPTATQVADGSLGELIETIFRHHRRRYGYRRLAQELSNRGVTCALARVRRLMAQRGLRALQPKNFVPKTSDGRADKPSPNLLSGQPCRSFPIALGRGTLPLSPAPDGSPWPSSSIYARAASWVGASLTTCARPGPRRLTPSPANTTHPRHHLPQRTRQSVRELPSA